MNPKLKAPLRHFRLTLLFAAIVFAILTLTMALVFFGIHLLAHFGFIGEAQIQKLPLFLFCMISILLGTILAAIFSRAPLRPIQDIMDATDRIADGDYNVRIHLKGPEDFKILSDKFNHMAEELGSVEMLRTDFVSNFSHEFKTPIVSIRGFAKALKWDDLSAQEREEYLDIIISESERLADLSTNVLYLSKLEKQTILTDVKRFNISEQIRLVVVLLDKKISEKDIHLEFDSKEYFMDGNEEMMRQVWINLLDNAIKFSPMGGKIEMYIRETDTSTEIKISNKGDRISSEMKKHIFDKFYQGDLSHSTPGNGLGLSIVKKIVELHNGTISVETATQSCTFIIRINRR